MKAKWFKQACGIWALKEHSSPGFTITHWISEDANGFWCIGGRAMDGVVWGKHKTLVKAKHEVEERLGLRPPPRLSGEPNPNRKKSVSGRYQRIVKCAKCKREVYLCAAWGTGATFYHWECRPKTLCEVFAAEDKQQGSPNGKSN
jgi:hypothetical protein